MTRDLFPRTCARAVVVLVACCCAWQLGTISSRAVRGTAPSRCSFLAPNPPKRDAWSQAKRLLAPPGADAIRLCRYAYRNNPRGADGDELVGRAVVRGSQLNALVRAFDALHSVKPNGTFTSCYFDDAPVVAHLRYPSGRVVTIFVVTSNCFSAANGDVTRNARDGAWLWVRKQLFRLTAR